jgi:hypothetical protein
MDTTHRDCDCEEELCDHMPLQGPQDPRLKRGKCRECGANTNVIKGECYYCIADRSPTP